MISANPLVTNADLALSPASIPSAIPAPRAMMFFKAPPSSTPMTSSLVYTRKDPDIRMDWANFAFAISIPATTVDAGFP